MTKELDYKTLTPEQKQTNLPLKLVGEDGNAFAIIGRARQTLRRGGHAELIYPFTQQATSGNYSNLLATCNEYFTVD